MQSRPDLRREVVEAVDDLGRPGVGAPGLRLLLVGEGEHTQAEDLVDLGGVEEVADALRGDLRLVVEDDRRRQHDVAVRSDEHRERAVVAATGDCLGGAVRWLEQRHERAVVDGEQGVHGDERVAGDVVARRARIAPVGDVLDADGDGEVRPWAVGPARLDAHHTVDGLPGPHGPAGNVAGRRREVVDRTAGREVDGYLPTGVGCRQQIQFGRSSARVRLPRPTRPMSRRRRQSDSVGLKRPPSIASSMRRCWTCRQRTRTCSRGDAPGIDDALGAQRPPLGAVELGLALRHEHAELPAQLVLAGRGAVRVEDVALVEHGIGDRPGGGEPVPAHSPAPGFLEQDLQRLVPRRPAPAAP